MKIFGFQKKYKVAGEINRLISLLGKKPANDEMQVRLAGLYLRVGD